MRPTAIDARYFVQCRSAGDSTNGGGLERACWHLIIIIPITQAWLVALHRDSAVHAP